MGQRHPERHRDTASTGERLRFDDTEAPLAPAHGRHEDDVEALRAENAQLRELVVRLSRIVVRGALERK